MKCFSIKMALVSSVLSAFITGCMSLEERLSSNDPAIKRAAEIELVRDAFREGNKRQRLAAVERVTYPEILVAIARSGKEDTKEEGLKAVAKIQEKNNLAVVAKNTRVKEIGIAACRKIVDQLLCVELAQNAALGEVRKAAYEKIQDQGKLLSIAQSSRDRAIKLSAMRLISNKNELLKIAFSSTTIANGRDAKSFKSSNASSGKMDMKKMAGIKNKMKTGGSRNSSMREGQTTIDVSLVDAFIANCDDDDVFIKMVDSYGDKLTSRQCEVLRVKSKNSTVHENLNSIADIKVANYLKAWIKGPGFNDVDEYCVEFMRIKNRNIKDSVFVDTCRGIHGRGSSFDHEYCESWIKVVKELSVECMLKCILEEGDHVADYVYCMDDDKAFPFIKGIMTEKNLSNPFLRAQLNGCFGRLMSKVRKEHEDDVIGILPLKINKELLGIVVEKIMTSDAAIAFLRKGFENVQDYMIRDCMLKFDGEYKSRILEEAKKRYESNKGKVCLGPFYLGMPLCDALMQREALGIRGGDAWFVLENVKNEDPNIIENWRISAMTFTPKAALKFLDCEDAHVLQQAIKQCVKKQKGRANSWDYASEIRTDVSFDSSTRIDFFSPTGKTTDYSSSIVSEYKNTKLGIGLRYDKETGALCFYKY